MKRRDKSFWCSTKRERRKYGGVKARKKPSQKKRKTSHIQDSHKAQGRPEKWPI